MAPYLLTLGDSVHWGQGLRPEHKLHTIVGTELRKTMPDLVDHLLAHSGATIGLGATITQQRVDGEVPIAYPTVFQQLEAFVGDPADVRVVLVNGGINDVDIRRVLNPLTPPALLTDLTWKHCRDGMTALLRAITAKLPVARVVVTAYFPILSYDSRLTDVSMLLEDQGIAASPSAISLTSGKNPVVDRCLLFWRESALALAKAVSTINLPRVAFIDPGFTVTNAVFATQPLLWGLTRHLGLQPEDEVIGDRRESCDLAIPPLDVLRREQCYRASAGHPNIEGARRYATAILRTLGSLT
jgi:lysophospholipase L1-like esterase